MLCMLVKLLITSSTLSSVRDDRRDILLVPASPLHNSPCSQVVCEGGGRSGTTEGRFLISACTSCSAVTARSRKRCQGLLNIEQLPRVKFVLQSRLNQVSSEAATAGHQPGEPTYPDALDSLPLMACLKGLKTTLAGLVAGLLSE